MPSEAPPASETDPSKIFLCRKCGDCCRGYGGTYINDEQATAIADYIGMDRDGFLREKCRLSGGKPLLAQREDGHCIFWDKLCTIYPVRPDMCRNWPFIDGILKDTANWHMMAGSCPGMRTDVSDEVIRDCVQKVILQRSK